jgi:predicted methyltransferase
MRRICAGLVSGWLCCLAGAVAATPPIPQYITAAVANPARAAADRERDALRKPAEVIAFAGIKPGDKVGELMPGRGYFTAIFCQIVGASGHVYTAGIEMAAPPPGPPRPPPPPSPLPCANVTATRTAAAAFALPSGLDVVWTSENYHDLHNAAYGAPDMLEFDRVIFNALKPGGVFIVEDHAAEAGSGARDTATLHRIDPALVRKEVTAAGFVFVAESNVLHISDDAHTAKVFDLKGHTDKFLLKFRRPAH